MDIKELERRLNEIFDESIEARNASNKAINHIQELRAWITKQEIARMQKVIKGGK